MKLLKSLSSALVVAASLLGVSSSAIAQTNGNWTSTLGGNWSTVSNWSSNPSVPGGNGSAVNLNADFTAGSKTINLDTDAVVGTMIFGDSNGISQLILSGANSTLTFNNNGSNATLTWQGATSSNISSAIKLDDSLVVSGIDMTGNFQGTISANSVGTKTIYTNNNNFFLGAISDGAGVVAINRVASKAMTLSGNNTFSGGVNLNATTAALTLGHLNALGTGTFTVGGAAVNVTVANAIAKTLNLNGANFCGSGNLTIEAMTITNTTNAYGKITRTGYTSIGSVALSDSATSKTLFVGTTNNGSGEVTGIISNGAAASGSLVKEGTGTWILSGANTYTGTTTVSAGTMIISNTEGSGTGTGTVTVSSGATLGGTGTISGATTISGIAAPGGGGSIGTLNIGNNVTWNGGATPGASTDWIFQLGAGSSADLLNITGDLIRGTGTAFRFDFAGGTDVGTFKVVDWTGSTTFAFGDFSYTNLGGGNTATFAVNGTQLDVTVIPEPATCALLAFALTAAVVFRRRRV